MTFWMPAPGIMAGGGAGGVPLTFPPTVTSFLQGTVAFTTHNTTICPTVNAGDLLILSYKRDNSAANMSSYAIAGWTTLPWSGNASGTDRSAATLAKIADGSEGGSVVAVSGSSNGTIVASYSIASSGLPLIGASTAANNNFTNAKLVSFNQVAGRIGWVLGTTSNGDAVVAAADTTVLHQSAQGTSGWWLAYKTALATAGTPLVIGCTTAGTNNWTACGFEQDVA